MKISLTQVRALVAVYGGCLTIMSILVPVPVLASIAAAFPDVPIVTVQMLVSIPSIAAIAGNFVFARLARYLHRKTCLLIAHSIFLFGLLPYFFHDSIVPALIAAALVGFAMGGSQNTTSPYVGEYFHGDAVGLCFGLCSAFVGVGGVFYTTVGAMLGAENWWGAYLAYLVVIPILALLCLSPKGSKEGAPEKGQRVKIPREVIALACFEFFYFACNNIFSNNISFLVEQAGLGGVIESGQASSVNTLCGLIGGLLCVGFKRIFKRQSLTVNAIMSAIGCVLIFTATSMLPIYAGAFFMAFAYAVYNSLGSQFATEASGKVGYAFNMALLTAAGSLGNFFSPMMVGAAASVFGGTAANSFMVGAGVCVVITVISAWYFNRYKAPADEAAGVSVQMAESA